MQDSPERWSAVAAKRPGTQISSDLRVLVLLFLGGFLERVFLVGPTLCINARSEK